MTNTSQNTTYVKIHNIRCIKNALIEIGTGSKNSIAKMTGLSIATCNTILNELHESGEILTAESGTSGFGRPAKMYSFNWQFAYTACFFLSLSGREFIISACITDLSGEIVTKQTFFYSEGTFQNLKSGIDTVLMQNPKIKAIGIGIPGIVTKEGTIDYCDLEFLNGINLSEVLSAEYGLPVITENDMNSSVYGFYQKQFHNALATVAAVSFSGDSLPGSGIVIDGKILRGFSNFAGEVAFLPFLMPRETIADYLTSTEGLIKISVPIICSLISIINPEVIGLLGTGLRTEDVRHIIAECSLQIPEKHIPQILLFDSIEPFYHSGLSALTSQLIL